MMRADGRTGALAPAGDARLGARRAPRAAASELTGTKVRAGVGEVERRRAAVGSGVAAVVPARASDAFQWPVTKAPAPAS
jgi:hypothetical protein